MGLLFEAYFFTCTEFLLQLKEDLLEIVFAFHDFMDYSEELFIDVWDKDLDSFICHVDISEYDVQD